MICSVLEAIPLIKKNFLVITDQHGGKNLLVGFREDRHERMYVFRYATSADSLVPVVLRDNKNAGCLSSVKLIQYYNFTMENA